MKATKRRGLVLPLVLILAVLFSILVFSVHTMQRNEMGLVAKTLDQQRALTMAEAGYQRAMARIVAHHWSDRWYKHDNDGDNEDFCGSFNSITSHGEDDDVNTPLDPHGSYEVYVQDHESEDTAGPPAAAYDTRISGAKVDHTEIISVGTYTNGGKETRVIVYARVAIVPEPLMYTVSPDAPEIFKKAFKYEEIYDKSLVALDVINNENDRQQLRTNLEYDLNEYMGQFIQNLDLVKAIRENPLTVPEQATFTADEISALFDGYPPVIATAIDLSDTKFKHTFIDEMIRNYRIKDNLPPNEGIRYEIPEGKKQAAISDYAPAPMKNIRDAFFRAEGGGYTVNLFGVHPAFLQTPSAVETGDQLLDYQVDNDVESNTYQTDVANCLEYYFWASNIPQGHTYFTTETVTGVDYSDSAHYAAFNAQGRDMSDYPEAMFTDYERITGNTASRESFNPGYDTQTVPISIVLSPEGEDEISLEVREFINFYLKYVDSRAEVGYWEFTYNELTPGTPGDGVSSETPGTPGTPGTDPPQTDPQPWPRPPRFRPDPPPPPPPGSNPPGNSGSGGSSGSSGSSSSLRPGASLGSVGGGGMGG